MSLRTIRHELAAAASTVADARVYDAIPANAELPAVVVGWPLDVRYNVDGDGVGYEVELPVTYAVARADLEAAQRDLDVAMSPAGVVAAIQTHHTNAWRGAVVTGAGDVRQLDEPLALAFDFYITVYP